jgi:U3 small nucleolar RNA-associated protein 3
MLQTAPLRLICCIFSRFVEDESATGPRSLTRAILKNKGLTPSRSKAVRNPRVKKRMRFDKAKKQVASKQAVYTGGQSALKGSYGGEATGISQVVKSRKF